MAQKNKDAFLADLKQNQDAALNVEHSDDEEEGEEGEEVGEEGKGSSRRDEASLRVPAAYQESEYSSLVILCVCLFRFFLILMMTRDAVIRSL
jgi:hypothetical protein